MLRGGIGSSVTRGGVVSTVNVTVAWPTLVASSEKIQRELGWKPRYTELRAIVETAWNWHRTHPKGYKD